nr:unnamed protein product [Ipomoea trifida]
MFGNLNCLWTLYRRNYCTEDLHSLVECLKDMNDVLIFVCGILSESVTSISGVVTGTFPGRRKVSAGLSKLCHKVSPERSSIRTKFPESKSLAVLEVLCDLEGVASSCVEKYVAPVASRTQRFPSSLTTTTPEESEIGESLLATHTIVRGFKL